MTDKTAGREDGRRWQRKGREQREFDVDGRRGRRVQSRLADLQYDHGANDEKEADKRTTTSVRRSVELSVA
jgi:hypothetical protein